MPTQPKTGTFQMRINPEIKAQVEQNYEKSGLTLTVHAISCFLQQSINDEAVSRLLLNQHNYLKEALRNVAIAQLMTEIRKGRDSVKTESDWVSEEEMRAKLGIDE